MFPFVPLRLRLRRHGRGYPSGETGVALVEFALILPLLLLLIVGTVDIGHAYNVKNTITHMANETARYAAVNSSLLADRCDAPADPALPPEPCTINRAMVDTGDSAAVISICFPTEPAVKGDPVHVTIRRTFPWFTADFVPGTDWNDVATDLVANSEMRLENDSEPKNYTYTPGGWDPATKTCNPSEP